MKETDDGRLDLTKFLDARLDQKILALPLQFQHLPVEIISKEYTKLNSNHPYRIHYLGPRFTSTHIIHKKYSGNGNHKDQHYFEQLLKYKKYEVQMRKIIQSNYLNQKLQNNHYYKSSIFYRAFEGMNPTLQLDNEFIFNSCFESANLDCAIKVAPMEFDLFLRIDSNTRGHTQWFYFSVQNGKKTGKVTFNICNLTKPKTLYEQGMRPYIFSKKKYQKYGRNWEQDGQNVQLMQKKLRYTIIYEMLQSLCVYKLSFQYTFSQEDDEVFFAYSIPYTYSQLLKDIQVMPSNIVAKHVLGRSLTGVDIPILHISNHENKNVKKNIIIIGRTHPGESNGSHVLNGFMNFLIGNSPQAISLRDRINFIIVPMANPDGVIIGNSRSSASGKDLNREYLTSKRELYPEVFYIKNLVYKIHKNMGVFMFFDFHGHSRKKNTFVYGPAYNLSQPNYYKSRAFAKMVQKTNNSFRFYSCSFLISDQKKGTARAVFFERFKIPYVFTVQSSIGLFYDLNKMKTVQFIKEEWQKMGNDICMATSQFVIAVQQYEQVIAERRRQRQKRRERIQRDKTKRIGKDKKFVEDGNNEQQENINTNLQKKKVGLMFELMDEIKKMPEKNIDPDASSDDHDDAQDLESSKLRQFNNLIIQTKQKDVHHKVNKIKEEPSMEQSILHKKIETEQNQQLQMLHEIEQQKKTKVIKVSKSIANSQQCLLQPRQSQNNINIQRRSSSLHRAATMRMGNRQPKNTISNNRETLRNMRKSVNFETHHHLVSKQFFPVDRCEIVDLPRSSAGFRKDIKKGRVMMDEYLRQKKMEKQKEKIIETEHKNQQPKVHVTKNIIQNRAPTTLSVKKFKIEDIIANRSSSQRKILQKRIPISKSISSSNRIFDSIILSGMQIDNMAMMIRTFNK